jgi:hypothetical protein
MTRRLLAFLLTLCLFWQSLAFAGAGVVVAEAQEHLHELLHFEGTAHHHDDHDGALHQDESSASETHVATDAGLHAPALMPLPMPAMPSLPSARPDEAVPQARPHPVLDGPERPPRLTA